MLPNICECMTPRYSMSLQQFLSETGGTQWVMRAEVPAAVQSLLPTARSAALSPQKQAAALANSGLRCCKSASTDLGACCQATGACAHRNFAPASGSAFWEGLQCFHAFMSQRHARLMPQCNVTGPHVRQWQFLCIWHLCLMA